MGQYNHIITIIILAIVTIIMVAKRSMAILTLQQRRATADPAAEGNGRRGRGNEGSPSKGGIDDDAHDADG